MSFHMSTQPIPRLRLGTARRRRQPNRAALIVLVLASLATFGAAYAVARAHSATDSGEPLQAGLPALSTPVPSALAPAPPIEVGVREVAATGGAVTPPTAPSSPPATAVTSPALAPVTSAPGGQTVNSAPVTAGGGSVAAPSQPTHATPPSSSETGSSGSFDSSG
jgi:hypothetical protein